MMSRLHLVLIILFILVFSTSMYLVFGAGKAVLDYRAEKKLVEEMGGLDNIIRQMEFHVERNQDPEGWRLLGRLYLKAQRPIDAKRAFLRSEELRAGD